MRAYLYLLLVLFISSCNEKTKNDFSDTLAITIYFNGSIITMEGNEAEYVESIAEKNGKIVFVGSLKDAEAQYQNAVKVDLEGKTMIPGFIDSHSHFVQTALKLNFVNLDPPPAGKTNSIEMLVNQLKEELIENPEKYKADDNWIIGWGFDNGFLEEGRFPNREDLDQVSEDFPIAIIHFSSHILVLNSKGLERAGYLNDDYTVPEGGVLQYGENGEPNGVIEEQAMLSAMSTIGKDYSGKPGKYISIPLPEALMKQKLIESQELYASNGFTTITEMAATQNDYEMIKELGDQGKLKLDVAMAFYSPLTSPSQVAKLYSTSYSNHYRVMGGKLNLDGGSPGRTAYLRAPYHTPTPGQPEDYRGYSSIKEQDDMNDLVSSYYEQRVPFFIHALGDAAVDQCIAAIKYSEENYGYDDPRTQIIHAQQVQPDQFEALKKHSATFTFQIAHNYYFGDYHNEFIYGPERTNRLNPAKEAVENGFSVTLHHDSPVHPVNQIDLIWIATNRSSRSGKVYGEEQRLSPYEALKASTIEAAYQFKEEKVKGSISEGKVADFVILDKNPLNVDISTIKDIVVLETIKEGVSVYKKKAEPDKVN